jgi:hypothetical protein
MAIIDQLKEINKTRKELSCKHYPHMNIQYCTECGWLEPYTKKIYYDFTTGKPVNENPWK